MSISKGIISKIFDGLTQLLTKERDNSDYTINSFSIQTPCSAVDNFLSEIYALSLSAKPNNNSAIPSTEFNYTLIAKSQILDSEEDARRYLFNIIFTKEYLMYSEILSRMEIFLEAEKHLSPALSPKLHHYYTEGESYSCIFMDNLVSMGYYIPQTHGTGIRLDECLSVMKSIARFHASSLVIEGEDGIPLPEKHEITTAEFLLCEATASTMSPLMLGSYNAIVELAEKYRPELVTFLKEYDAEKGVWSRITEFVKPGTTSFSCLCHGDVRLNNVFIKKDDVSIVRFIDFQLTRYASPLTDLQYVLNVGATKEFRSKHTDQVLRSYFEEFTSVLNDPSKLLPSKEAAVREWTLEKLKEEYEALTEYGFLIAIMLLPIILLRPGDIDKSVSQMGKAEREKFWNEGRKEMVFELGCKHPDVRERMLDICEEAQVAIKKRRG